jgi:hypothetical protein
VKNIIQWGGDRIYALKKEHHTYDELAKMKLTTERTINQLSGIMYDDPLIEENIDLWLQLIELREYGFINTDEWRDILVNLYRFTRPFNENRDEYFNIAQEQGRHATLNIFLKNITIAYK